MNFSKSFNKISTDIWIVIGSHKLWKWKHIKNRDASDLSLWRWLLPPGERSFIPPFRTALATWPNTDFLRYGRLSLYLMRALPLCIQYRRLECADRAFSWQEHVGDSPDALHFFYSVPTVLRSWVELKNSQSMRVVKNFLKSVKT
jgi:hypothetical protein